MSVSTPATNFTGRARRRLVSLLMLALVIATGCASNVPPKQLATFESQSDTILRFARNPIVCAPTALGNAAGALAGGPLALLLFGPAKLIAWARGDDDLAFEIYGTAFWVPVLLTGGATGAVFLPMSYVMSEQPCELGVSTGWKE